MIWFRKNQKSGSTSGSTATVISESVQLIETQTADIYHDLRGDNKPSFKKYITYSVYYIQTHSDGFSSYVVKRDYIDDKKEADAMYKYLLENRGKTTQVKTVKEKTFKIESND